MANLRYSLLQFDGRATLTLFYGDNPLVANDEHPNWEAILKGVTIDDDPSVADLFDVTKTVAEKFQRLGERVTASNNRIYFDGDEVNNTLTKKILEFVVAGVDDWMPLVKFMEKVFDNPQEHSREQLFDWLGQHAFAINEDGDILGYKGVERATGAYAEKGFAFQSVTSGSNKVAVDNEVFTGKVPQNVGSVVEMARSEISFNPAEGCAAGLHVANFRYANEWGRNGCLLLVAVSPRDVVSVPTESNWEKVRVCRYRVVEVVDTDSDRYEDVAPLHREVKDETVKPTEFKAGDRVRIIGDHWYASSGEKFDDLLDGDYQITFGALGTVTDLPYTRINAAKNTAVRFDGVGYSFEVANGCLELVKDPEPEEDSWDSWDDDDDSWSW